MRRLLSILIAILVFTLSTVTYFPANAVEELNKYIIPVVSDISGVMHIIGLSNDKMLKEGNIMIPIEEACKIADASIKLQDDESIIISRNTVSWCCEYNDDKKQYLIVDMDTGKGDFYQSVIKKLKKKLPWNDFSGKSKTFSFNPFEKKMFSFCRTVDYSEKTEIPYNKKDDQLYVSFYPFLKMLGVNISIINDENKKITIDVLNRVAAIYENDSNLITIEDINNYYNDEIGFETYISCELGTPIDKLYQQYYNNDYFFNLSDYYSNFNVTFANIVNSVSNFDGFTKTLLSASNLDYIGSKYFDSILSVVCQKGTYTENTNDKTAQKLQDMIIDFGIISSFVNEDLILVPNTKWCDEIGHASTGFQTAVSMYIGYLKASSIYDDVKELFADDKNILKNSILSSKTLKEYCKEENKTRSKIDIIKSVFGIAGDYYAGLYNVSKVNNSYIELVKSANEVQNYIDHPEIMRKVYEVFDGLCTITDSVLITSIDAALFEGVHVTDIVCNTLSYATNEFKKTPYYNQFNNIANIDDYVFIQSIAKECFDDSSLQSDERYYCYILGIKASLTAYIAEDMVERKRTDLKHMLSDAISANREYYRTSYNDAPDLRELLGENTDMSKLEEIIQKKEADSDFKVKTSNSCQFGRLVKNEETVIFTKWDHNDNFSIVEQDIQSGSLNTLVSAKISGSESTPNIALLGNHLYYTDKNGINLYNLETKSAELKWSGENCRIIGINETEQNLILQGNSKYYTYDFSNDECKKIIDVNNSWLLTTDGANIYYSINDDKIGAESDKIYYTHIYKCELATSSTTELATIAINNPAECCIYGSSCIANNKLIFSYSLHYAGTSGTTDYTIDVLDLQTLELNTVATKIFGGHGDVFSFCNSYIYYQESAQTTIQYNIESGDYQTLNIGGADAAIEDVLLYTIGDDYKYNYCKYDLSNGKNTTLLNHNDLISNSDPSDAYCDYNCVGVIDNLAVIEITIYSYQEEYKPIGWRPGYVRSIFKIIEIEHKEDDNLNSTVSKWKELYEKQVKEMPVSTNNNGLPQEEFLLYDMNNDNVPELIYIEYGELGDCFDIFTIYNNEVVSLGKMVGYIFYNKEENTIINGYNLDGSGNVTYIGYNLEDSKLNEQFKLFYDDFDFENSSKKYTYKYNDEDISEQKYKELLSKLIPSNLIHITDSYDIKRYTTDEIGIKLAFHPEEKVIGKVVTKVDDLNVRNEPNTSSDVIGKLPKDSEVEIVAARSGWYQVDMNGRVGFVSVDYISLIDQEVKTSINPYIEVFTAAPWGDGFTYILHVNGNYSYYKYEQYYDCGGGIICESGTYDKTTLNLGTVSPGFRYLKVVITPYNEAGEAGETVEIIKAENPEITHIPKIEDVNKMGSINASKGTVSGYDETYVIYNGQPNEKIRESLGDGWHVTAVKKCETKGVTWYKRKRQIKDVFLPKRI